MGLGLYRSRHRHQYVRDGSRITQPLSFDQVSFSVFVLLILALWPWSWSNAEEKVLQIQSIAIRGNQHIEASAIQGKLTIKPGDVFSPKGTREQIQLIYAMGFFEDVQVETTTGPQGVNVVFLVREKPFNVEVVFDGNDHLSEDKLQEKTTIGSQVFLDQEQVKVSVKNIRQAYQEEG